MDLNTIVRWAQNLYYGHKGVVIAGALVLIAMILIKPKQVLKAIGILAAAAVGVYIVSLIGEMIFSGVGLKDQMINKSP